MDGFYRVAFMRKLYSAITELQKDVDEWIGGYDGQRPHSGKYCDGKTPMQILMNSLHSAKEKVLDYNLQTAA